MKKETKEALYSMLDLMDTLSNLDFVKADIERTNKIRKEVLNIINENTDETILDKDPEELLGVLPMILLDNNKFPAAKDVLEFAEKCLNIEVKNYWYKRSKPEVIGIVISEVSKQSPNQFISFLRAWNQFNDIDVQNYKNSIESNSGFVEKWLKFIEDYKGID